MSDEFTEEQFLHAGYTKKYIDSMKKVGKLNLLNGDCNNRLGKDGIERINRFGGTMHLDFGRPYTVGSLNAIHFYLSNTRREVSDDAIMEFSKIWNYSFEKVKKDFKRVQSDINESLVK